MCDIEFIVDRIQHNKPFPVSSSKSDTLVTKDYNALTQQLTINLTSWRLYNCVLLDKSWKKLYDAIEVNRDIYLRRISEAILPIYNNYVCIEIIRRIWGEFMSLLYKDMSYEYAIHLIEFIHRIPFWCAEAYNEAAYIFRTDYHNVLAQNGIDTLFQSFMDIELYLKSIVAQLVQKDESHSVTQGIGRIRSLLNGKLSTMINTIFDVSETFAFPRDYYKGDVDVKEKSNVLLLDFLKSTNFNANYVSDFTKGYMHSKAYISDIDYIMEQTPSLQMKEMYKNIIQ